MKTVVPSLGVMTMSPVSECCTEIRVRRRYEVWLEEHQAEKREVTISV